MKPLSEKILTWFDEGLVQTMFKELSILDHEQDPLASWFKNSNFLLGFKLWFPHFSGIFALKLITSQSYFEVLTIASKAAKLFVTWHNSKLEQISQCSNLTIFIRKLFGKIGYMYFAKLCSLKRLCPMIDPSLLLNK